MYAPDRDLSMMLESEWADNHLFDGPRAATSTELDRLITDTTADLIDICLSMWAALCRLIV